MSSGSVADWFNAVGTIAVAVLAIWGDQLKAILVPHRLQLLPHNLRGQPTKFQNGKRVIYYHLQVKNGRRFRTAHKVRVMLVGYARRGPSGEYREIPMLVPFQLAWAPQGITPTEATIE